MNLQEKCKDNHNQNIKVGEQDYSLVLYNDNSDEQSNSLKTKEENVPSINSKKDFQKIDKNKSKNELNTDSEEEYKTGYNSRNYSKKRNSYYDGKYDSYYNGNFDSDDEDEYDEDEEDAEDEELGNKDDFSNYSPGDRDISLEMPVFERIVCKGNKNDDDLPEFFMSILLIALVFFLYIYFL